jgi:hypothetical protein
VSKYNFKHFPGPAGKGGEGREEGKEKQGGEDRRRDRRVREGSIT